MKNLWYTPLVLLLIFSLNRIETFGQSPDSGARNSYYFVESEWNKTLDSAFLNRAPFEFVQNNETLPNVLLIGNSISIGYTSSVREVLFGSANVYRIPENGGDTYKFLENYKKWLSSVDWDIIHINIGLHDLKRLNEKGKLDIRFERNNSPEQYSANLQQIFEILTTESDGEIIWATTTFVPEGSNGRISGEEALYNEISIKVLSEFPDIHINDLYQKSLEIKPLQREANVHYTPEGSEELGAAVAGFIGEYL